MSKLRRFSAVTVALLYVAVSLLVLAAFATPLWYAWRATVQEDRTHILRADMFRLRKIFNEQGVQALTAEIDVEVGSKARSAEDLLILTDPQGVKIAGNIAQWPDGVTDVTGIHNIFIDVEGKQTRVAVLYVPLRGGYHLLVANNIERYRELERLLLLGLGVATGIVVLLGIAGGMIVRRTLLDQVKDINQATAAVMAGNFSHRLPHYRGESELDILVATQNRMLEQIEKLIDSVRNVSHSVAHDLRTPLAELRSRLEELTLTRPGVARTFDEIDGAIADVDRVINIFNALLRLAEIDSGARRAGFVEIDAAHVAGEVVEFYQPLAESQGRRLSFFATGPLRMSGDPLLLAQAIGNLIDNALKFCQQRGVIAVRAGLDADGVAHISVADDGPGIADADKHKVLERFYRGDASRGTPGVGLGLSLVAAVVRLHRGTLQLSDNHPGLTVSLHLKC